MYSFIIAVFSLTLLRFNILITNIYVTFNNDCSLAIVSFYLIFSYICFILHVSFDALYIYPYYSFLQLHFMRANKIWKNAEKSF